MENEKTSTEQSSSRTEHEVVNNSIFEKLETLEQRLIKLEDRLVKPLIN